MLTFILLVLVLLVLLFLLWLLRNVKHPTKGGFGTRIEDPDFKPVPRPPETFVEPPRREVAIKVERNAQGIPVNLNIGQDGLRLAPGEQVAWNGGASRGNEGGKVEIRFSPNASPFKGASFTTARSGVALSGVPLRQRGAQTQGASRRYTVLVTTPDGYLLTKTASLVLPDKQVEQAARQAFVALDQFDEPAPPGGYGEQISDPDFEPVDRPVETIEEPTRRDVKVSVIRGEGGELEIIVDPEDLSLGPNEQAAWSTGPRDANDNARLEIRFAPNSTPFGGDTFVIARGGTAFSGRPVGGSGVYAYKVLVTTPDGVFQLREKDARITVTS